MRSIVKVSLIALLLSACGSDKSEDSTDKTTPVEQSCEEQTVDECTCGVATGHPYDETRGCYGAAEPYRCMTGGDRGGTMTYAVDPDGRCWQFNWTFFDGEDGDVSDLNPGWTIVEDETCPQDADLCD